ncbi:MAG: DUF6318 family protein [Actinomyces sp.]|jgi:hypothetical protein|nr:DUF6318 family protein [Actinomyces sp.]MCI1641711.1 DUF6318 family protein [Actinomyces sp.]MCI1661816.1 DUF6318 family protein [Actinomyces sp.]MCI1690658.1 DUF6318 family protein [Actinomyces sp.]MCI1786742.1 DUF6318 family protein [Actinomyces sp.]MCI1829116.1 DUF6318 family protein [Actinomyces sp.]
MTHTGVFTRLLPVLAIGLAGCFLTACSNQDSGNDPPSGMADPTGRSPTPELSMSGGYVVGPDGHLLKPSDGPEPQPPASPISIGDNTPEAAEEFARYFIAVTEYAWNTGDTALLRKISTEDCELCNGMATNVEERYRKGGWNDNLRYEVTQADSPIPYPNVNDKYAILLHVTTSADASYADGHLDAIDPDKELIELHTCFIEKWIVCGGAGADDTESE